MTGHDPRAADVLAHAPLLYGWDRYRTLGPRRADELLDALAAAGLVVRPADDEYEPAMQDGAQLYLTRDGMATTIPAHSTDRPLYVRKENPDD